MAFQVIRTIRTYDAPTDQWQWRQDGAPMWRSTREEAESCVKFFQGPNRQSVRYEVVMIEAPHE